MKKLIYITLLTIAVILSFKVGQKSIKVSKYDYLNLHDITMAEINGEKITIHTLEGNSYIVHGVRR